MSFLSQAFQATTAENQSSIISFANSSTEPLPFTTPGALNFEGAWVSGANYSSIQVSILSNTHCFLYVEQSFFPDGRDPIQTFNYFYDSTGYELVTRFAYITCPFVRVVVANESAGNTLFFLSTKLTASASSTVNISNFPATQTVSGSVLSLGTLPNGTTQSSIKLNTNGALITTSTATGSSAASVTAWGQDSLGASYPLPLTTGGAEIAMSITDPLPAGTAHIGEVSISNLPAVQDISGTVVVASITAPLPAGNNSLGKIQLQARNTYGQGVMDLTSVDGINGVNEPTQSLAVAQTAVFRTDQYYNNEEIFSSVGAYGALQSLYDSVKNTGQKILPIPLSNENDILTLAASIKATVEGDTTKAASSAVAYGTDGTNYYSMPLTAGGSQVSVAVSNLPLIQDISGTVTVASITEPLPTGTNRIGTVQLMGYNNRGVDIIEANPTVYKFSAFSGQGSSVGIDAVALVTTTDAIVGNASTAICAMDDGTHGGDVAYLSSTMRDRTDASPISALYTYVDNLPAVQVVAGQETDYMFYPTPATNVAQVYADGIQGVNITGGWSYTSTQVGTPPFTGSRNKINWYLYGSTDASTDFTVSQLSNVYAVINQKSTLGMASELPFITIYTRPDSGTNVGGWYKNKLTYDTLTNSLYDGTTGMKLLYTGADPVGIHPEITGLNRVKLNFDPIFSTVASESLAYGEGVWLGTLQTNSAAAPNGTRNFVFSEYSMMWSQTPIVLPISQNQVQVFDKALNASAATLVTDLSGITITANKLQVGGTVAVSNFPATQPVSGTFFQATQPVSGTFWQATQPVSGTVAISNFPEGGSNVTIVSPLPAGSNAIGSVTVSNFPPGGTEVSVSNFPTTQPISGTVSIDNFPAGGSEVSVVSALPTGANTIGAVKLVNQEYENKVGNVWFSCRGIGNLSAYSVSPQYSDFTTSPINIEVVASSLDIFVKPSSFSNADPAGITLKIQISDNTYEWATLQGYSINIKESPYPQGVAINDVRINANFVRIVALQEDNPTAMSMYATLGVLWKQ